MTGINHNLAQIAMSDEDKDRVYDLSLNVNLAVGNDSVGNYTVNLIASFDADPDASAVSTSVQINFEVAPVCPNLDIEIVDYYASYESIECPYTIERLAPIAYNNIQPSYNVTYGQTEEITLEFINPLVSNASLVLLENIAGLEINITKNDNPDLVIA